MRCPDQTPGSACADRPPTVRVVLLAKAPVPGRVKTRLGPVFTPAEAAGLARAAIEDTVAAVLSAARQDSRLQPVVAVEGSATGWLPPGLRVLPQRGRGLDERITAALDDAGTPALLIGMDTPQLRPEQLLHAVDRLRRPGVDAVLGPAADGGFWALGLCREPGGLVLGVPMSTSWTGRVQLSRLRGAGLRVELLETLRDVDTPADAEDVARQAPGGCFARTLADMLAERSGGPVGAGREAARVAAAATA